MHSTVRASLLLLGLAICNAGLAQVPGDTSLPDSGSSISRSVVPGARTESPGSPEPEARAMWVVRYSLLSPSSVHAIVEKAHKYHFNALMVQVRGRGDAYYQSNLEPRAEALSDQPRSFDPLAQIIQEAHGYGIQVHAWMDSMLVWSGKQAPRSREHVVNQHPEWIDARYDGHPMSGTQYEGEFLNPGIPEVRRYTVDVCTDIARRYDIDGIHLDYIRYPGPDLGYNPSCLSAFYAQRHPGESGNVPEWRLRAETRTAGRAWTTWKQNQVTELVREVRQSVQAQRPWIAMSAAVWANLDDARYERMQDWPTWLREGLVDFVCPMAYSTSIPRVVSQIKQAIRLSNGRQIWAGIGAWQMKPAATARMIQAVRELGVSGICLFSYGGVTSEGASEKYLKNLCNGPFEKVTEAPDMPWLPRPQKLTRTPGASALSGS